MPPKCQNISFFAAVDFPENHRLVSSLSEGSLDLVQGKSRLQLEEFGEEIITLVYSASNSLQGNLKLGAEVMSQERIPFGRALCKHGRQV